MSLDEQLNQASLDFMQAVAECIQQKPEAVPVEIRQAYARLYNQYIQATQAQQK